VENKKIDVKFGLLLIVFLVLVVVLIKNLNAQRVNDYKEYIATITGVVRQKDNKIKNLSYQLVAKQKENEDLKNTLAETRNSLDALSKKLAQPAPVAAPATASK